jgi:hypothetical protein
MLWVLKSVNFYVSKGVDFGTVGKLMVVYKLSNRVFNCTGTKFLPDLQPSQSSG